MLFCSLRGFFFIVRVCGEVYSRKHQGAPLPVAGMYLGRGGACSSRKQAVIVGQRAIRESPLQAKEAPRHCRGASFLLFAFAVRFIRGSTKALPYRLIVNKRELVCFREGGPLPHGFFYNSALYPPFTLHSALCTLSTFCSTLCALHFICSALPRPPLRCAFWVLFCRFLQHVLQKSHGCALRSVAFVVCFFVVFGLIPR